MLMIRLQRVGRKNDPSFRAVVTDSQNGPQSGKFLEVVGTYDVQAGKTTFNADRIKHWLAHGAQLSATLRNLLIDKKIITGDKTSPLPTPKPKAPEPETPVVAETPAAEPVAEAAPETTPEPVIEVPAEPIVEPTPEPAPEEIPAVETPTEVAAEVAVDQA